MKQNIKFIKTKINEDDTYIIVTKCDYCPFFIKDKLNSSVRCSKKNLVVNEISNNLIFDIDDENLVIKNGQPIPYWCELSDKMKDVIDNKRIIYVKNNMLYDIISFYDKEKIFSDAHIKFKKNSNELTYNEYGEKFILKKESENNKSYGAFNYPKFHTPPHIPIIKNICSCCGENKEEVKMNINNGMCLECNGKYKLNDIFKYNSYINNFRLKRQSDWSENKFKVINNII